MRSTLVRYGYAVAGVLVAAVATEALQSFDLEGFVFVVAVPVVVWFGGRGPGVLAIALSVLALHYVFVAPSHTGSVLSTSAYFAVFALLAVLTSLLSEARHRAERSLVAELQRANAQMRAEQSEIRKQAELLSLAHDAVIERDREGRISFWSRGAEETYGWTASEALGRQSHELLQTRSPVELKEVERITRELGRWEGELVHVRKDGASIVVASRWSQQRDERGEPSSVLQTNTDITARRHADEELRRSERRYRNIFELAGVAILEEDFSRVKQVVDALKAEGVTDFTRYIADHPEIVRRTLALVRVTDANEAAVELFGARSKAEFLRDAENLTTREVYRAWVEQLPAVAEGRRSFQSEVLLTTFRNEKVSGLVTIVFPDESSGFESVLVTVIDLSERNRAQEALHQAQAALAHATRVTTLGELTASIAHEVNQPLGAVVTNGEAALRWLGREPAELDEARRAVEHVIGDGRRASEVVARLRALAKKGEPQRTVLAVNGVIREAIQLVQRELVNQYVTLELELEPDPEPAPVLGDRVQLQQVLVNLMINAVQAIAARADGPREVRVASQQFGPGEVLVAVQDSGVGVDPEIAQRLFAPFFTTKLTGMGMGLAISRSIIEAHGGRLWLEARQGQGARFAFTLPVARPTGAS